MSKPGVVLASTLACLIASGCADRRQDWLGPDTQSLDNVAARARSLVNGSTYGGHPAVGLLLVGNALCTATLVGRRTVVTAAHCVKNASMEFRAGGTKFAVASYTAHPGYDPNAEEVRDDVAIVRLTSAPSIQPASLSSRAPYVGLQTTLIGYGRTAADADDAGTKRIGFRKASAVTQTEIQYQGSSGSTPNLCYGDSGGPSFATLGGVEVQTGVHSYILSPQGEQTCGLEGRDMRVDTYLSWLKTQANGDVFVDGVGPDTQPPVVKIVTPSAGAVAAGGNVTLRADVTDDIGLDHVDLFIDGQKQRTLQQGPYEFQITNLPLSGAHTLTVMATDRANNTAQDSVTINTAPDQDNEPPKVAIISPRQAEQVAADTEIKALVSDNVGVREVSLLVNGQKTRTLTQPPFNFNVSLPGGAVQLTVEAIDIAGNPGSMSISVSVPEGQAQQPGAPGTPGAPLGPPAQQGLGGTLSGGCNVGGSPAPPSALLLLLPLVLLRRRRR
ncbi:MAG: trypsin-like serine protease [Myxococcales bacterium]|nr:trypsin-like serine protease [Myxococcales bacterium]